MDGYGEIAYREEKRILMTKFLLEIEIEYNECAQARSVRTPHVSFYLAFSTVFFLCISSLGGNGRISLYLYLWRRAPPARWHCTLERLLEAMAAPTASCAALASCRTGGTSSACGRAPPVRQPLRRPLAAVPSATELASGYLEPPLPPCPVVAAGCSIHYTSSASPSSGSGSR